MPDLRPVLDYGTPRPHRPDEPNHRPSEPPRRPQPWPPAPRGARGWALTAGTAVAAVAAVRCAGVWWSALAVLVLLSLKSAGHSHDKPHDAA